MHIESHIDDPTIIRHIRNCGFLVALIGYGLYSVAHWVA